MVRKYIIDCDPGLDDARSILTLITDPNDEILAITIVSGNTHALVASYNAGITLNAIDRNDVPIFQGYLTNLDGESTQSDFYFGPSGFGKIRLPAGTEQVRSDMLAPDALIYYAQAYPNEIILLCVGPLTNLALAYQKMPDITSLFKSIFIMGGDSSEKTSSNVTEYAEFNFYADPSAAEIVLKNFGFNSSNPIYITDWTLCFNHPINIGFYQELAGQLNMMGKTSIAEIFAEIPPGVTIPPDTDVNDVEMIIADEFAAMVAYDFSIATSVNRVICVSIDKYEPTKGHSDFQSSSSGNIVLIGDIDFEKFKNTITNVMINSIYIP